MQIIAIVNYLPGDEPVTAEEASVAILASLNGDLDKDSCTVTVNVVALPPAFSQDDGAPIAGVGGFPLFPKEGS